MLRIKDIDESQKWFINSAIESANTYLQNAGVAKHTRIVFPVLKIRHLISNSFELLIGKKLRFPESVCICIQSNLVNPRLYSDFANRYISSEYYDIIRFSKNNGLIVSVDNELADILHCIDPKDIAVISDLRFLINNVKKWYGKYGHLISTPCTPHIPKSQYFTRGYESDNQLTAIDTALTSKISYIWGAPGTGKTQVVLANCIMTYIKMEHKVMILAPTNNAIEQTLRAVIRTMLECNESIEPLLRLGTASEEFYSDYCEICEKRNVPELVEDIKREINALKTEKKQYELAQNVIDAYENFVQASAEYHINVEKINSYSSQLEAFEFRLKQSLIELSALELTLKSTEKLLITLTDREKSLSFKFKRLFTDKEQNAISAERESLNQSYDTCKSKITSTEFERATILQSMQICRDEIEAATAAKEEALMDAERLAMWVFGRFTDIDDIAKDFIKSHDEAQGVCISPDIDEKIANKEAELEKISSDMLNSLKDKLVFALTIDNFFAHYKNMSNLGIELSQIAHVFLDEAAYCPLIKAGIIFSLGTPVTLLGDHMQLPPICEAPDRAIRDKESKLFLWSMSSIYFPQLLDTDFSVDTLYDEFINKRPPSSTTMSTATLAQTFRFGNNLASVLDEFVYKNGFFGQSEFDTDITVIAAKRSDSEIEIRSNTAEADAIRKFILKEKPTDFVIMTPYKAQVQYLANTLKDIISTDNVLTIHSSQGREWDTVIISVVDTSRKYMTDSSITQGLYTMNTAISRAKKNVVLVCDARYWKRLKDTQLIGKLASIATKISVEDPL